MHKGDLNNMSSDRYLPCKTLATRLFACHDKCSGRNAVYTVCDASAQYALLSALKIGIQDRHQRSASKYAYDYQLNGTVLIVGYQSFDVM
jgi:hypothetical protein